MMSVAHPITDSNRRWAFALFAAGVVALAGCKSDKDTTGRGIARGKNDVLIVGPNIPPQNVPVRDRTTGPNGTPDPLTTPTAGGKAGYNDDPERFKGVYIPGPKDTTAGLASLPTRIKDGDELKIADTPGVPLVPGGGTGTSGSIVPPTDVEPLLAQLQKYGVSATDRSLERVGTQYTFRATVPIVASGAHREYVGTGATAREAVKQVLDQVANDPK